jgi:hypothetical protein
MAHLAEALAVAGFLVLSAEYPESLAASYDRAPGLDRAVINQALLARLGGDADGDADAHWQITPTGYGIVGHSLGTGTVQSTGDETWARVALAGFPRQRDGSRIAGNLLLIASLQDGAMNLNRIGGKAAIPDDFVLLANDHEEEPPVDRPLPRRAAWILEGADAPNHISFLAEGVNDAMINLLSPLLPVAQLANLPVLDFDRYQISRDSAATARKLHPVIVRYLQQEMKVPPLQSPPL